jgi:hypothetical protein
LLPVTKWQFEQFIAKTRKFNRSQYKAMLALNPGLPPEELTMDARERLFLTGILPEEVQAFARWLGEDFDIPTAEEWRAVNRALRLTPMPTHNLLSELVEEPAATIVAKLSTLLQPYSIFDLALMDNGLVEWVRLGQDWVGLGAPRPEFHPNLWDPFDHEVKTIQPDERLPYFGFRLVRRGEGYLANEGEARFIY